MTAQAAVTGMVTTERSIRQGASGKGGTPEASWLVSQGPQRNTPCPCTQLSKPPLPLLPGKDDFMGRSSRGAPFKLLGLFGEGPCVKQRFNPSPAHVCLNHPGKAGRNGSCLLPGQVLAAFKASLRTNHTEGV